jgi:hypothetical protein
MSYLAPYFNPDVFVSYSHGDPRDPDSPLNTWTQTVIHRLVDGLHALETEFDGLQVWMDPIVDPTTHLTDELKAIAGASGVLMIVVSDRFLRSSWCGAELEWFRKELEARANKDGRVVLIRAQRTDEWLWPDFLRDAGPSFAFYDRHDGFPMASHYRIRTTTTTRH